MIKRVEFILNGLENTSRVAHATVLTEQTDELGLEQMLIGEAVLDDERLNLVELFHASAELKEKGCRVRIDMRRNVGSC